MAETLWVAMITMHQVIGTVGIQDTPIGIGRYLNETRDLCEMDGRQTVEHLNRTAIHISDMPGITYTFECQEIPIQKTVWTPPR